MQKQSIPSAPQIQKTAQKTPNKMQYLNVRAGKWYY